MAKETKNKPDKRALDILIEQADSFDIETSDGTKKKFNIYPLQLGRLAMISQRLIDLDLALDDDSTDVVQKMWKICADKTQKVAEIIAIATLKTKEDIDNLLKDRTDELLWSPTMTSQAYVNLLYIIVFQSYFADFMNAIRSVRMLRVTISQETEAARIAHMAEEVYGGQ